MAKDGTNRGGRRLRAGAKPGPLGEKLAAGRPAKSWVLWRLVEAASFRVVVCWFSACCGVMPPRARWGRRVLYQWTQAAVSRSTSPIAPGAGERGWKPSRISAPGAQACAARQSAFFMKFQTITTMTSSPLREMMSRISSRDMSLS